VEENKMENKNFEITFSKFSEKYSKDITKLETEWILENITYGFVASNEEEILKNTNDYFFVALNEGNVIGYIKGEIIEENVYNIFPKGISFLQVNDIYVLKKHRNKNIGEKLLKIIEEEANNHGIMHVLISTATKDAETIKRFYEKKWI
jgi:GNAT superfamily N-acetyltransferase